MVRIRKIIFDCIDQPTSEVSLGVTEKTSEVLTQPLPIPNPTPKSIFIGSADG